MGKTSGRGHKGSKQRSGGQISARYEGGQMPLHMRLPKLRGPHAKTVDAHRSVPDLHHPGEPVPPGRASPPVDVVSPGDPGREGHHQEVDERVKILAEGELNHRPYHPGSRLQRGRPDQDRSRRRHGGSDLSSGVH